MSEQTKAFPPIPRLSYVADSDDVQKKKVESAGGKSFSLDYISWARTTEMLREHAPGWLAMMVPNKDGDHVHRAPNGSGYLMIAFRHQETGYVTEAVPHALMDNRNNAAAGDAIDSRDIADGFVRGICKAAAVIFGLAWQLWSKDDPLSKHEEPKKQTPKPPEKAVAPDPYELVEYAIQAMSTASDFLQLGEIAARVKVSKFQGADAESARLAYADAQRRIRGAQ